ncbi:MAG: nucleotidyl transferase AbiEii/AbiGii toxin family protein [Anaerolineales bacterium]|nr:nucleotidyl transferase AbiEii/AbiGii toxin family protein [Anaerolineales bacterium]
MVPVTELRAIACRDQVPLSVIERDYVLSWLLWGIYQHPLLAENLILKGGNCLRQIYFPRTRYSDDLDFTTFRADMADVFMQHLAEVCQLVKITAGIDFVTELFWVQEKPTPHEGCTAIDARVYYRGIAGNASVTMKVKFDISEYEMVALPIQWHPLQHPYSDHDYCDVEVQTYSLEEVLAEKLRCWIQRTRPRDLFDIVSIIRSGAVPLAYENIMAAFLEKTIYKRVPLAGRDEMLYGAKFVQVETHWGPAIRCPAGSCLEANDAVMLFKDFIARLFTTDYIRLALGGLAPSWPISPTPAMAPPRFFGGTGQAAVPADTAETWADRQQQERFGTREAIIAAGRARRLIRLRYGDNDRDIEPYSFRYKNRDGQEYEYFYGFDRSRGNHIKSFFLHKIRGVSILPDSYEPRWEIEF